jgi:hypothetical protein
MRIELNDGELLELSDQEARTLYDTLLAPRDVGLTTLVAED